MPELSDEVIAGLLGGGVAGAIIAGLIALTTQSRLFRREDRYRFNDLKREKYVSLLVGADRWLQQVSDAYRAHLNAKQRNEWGEANVPPPPPVEIGEPATLKKLAQEVSLLGDDAVMSTATNISDQIDFMDDVRRKLKQVGVYAVWTPDELKARGRDFNTDDDTQRTLTYSRRVIEDFFEAARADLGVANAPGPISRFTRRRWPPRPS